jgi:CubicO group peptidase (beta-lactamase class C family)
MNVVTLAFAAAILIPQPETTASPAPPPRVAAFLEAIEGGDPATTLPFVKKEFDEKDLQRLPPEPRSQRLARIGGEHPGLAFVRVLHESPRVLRWLARDAKNQYLEIAFELSPDPPHGIVGVDLEPADETTGLPVEPKATDAQAAASARAWLDELASKDRFSGSVLMARDGRTFFEGAWGMTDREKKLPNRPDTSYNLASIGKIFTQVAIAQLASLKKLALTDTIAKHIPDLPVPSSDRITIQQLVTHSSGMGDIFGEKYEETPPSSLKRLSDYIPFFAGVPLRFAPGEGNSYSNAGYVVLGLIVEKISGKEFHEYLRDNVFVPAGMKDTGPYEPGVAVANRATGYTRQGPPGAEARPVTATLPARNSSAGGSRSSAPDLLKFDQALRQDRLLPKTWTDWIFSNKPGPRRQAAAPTKDRRGVLAIAGGSPGVSTAMEMNTDAGTTIIVLANRDPQTSERVLSRLRQWLPKRKEDPSVSKDGR